MQLLLIINTACCLMMTGIIWLIQLVHYPCFPKVGESNFVAFHRFHTQSISMVVMPLMLVELATSFYLIYQKSAYQFWWQFLLSLVLIIWLSTFFLQVPAHNALANGFDAQAYQKLINTNWIRTISWSFRSVILCFIVYKLMG